MARILPCASTRPRFTHVILHNRVAAPKSVFRLQAAPDALGRMPLLFSGWD